MPKSQNYQDKTLIIFDLDGTLTETKSNLRPDMAKLLRRLLEEKQVAIIGGGMYQQLRKQFLPQLKAPKRLLPQLSLFPTTATSCYLYQNGWKVAYMYELTKKQKQEVKRAFAEVFKEIHYVPPVKTYGKVLEDRGTQFTLSFLGQDVVKHLGEKGVRLKKEWTRKNTPLKLKIARLVQKRLPNLEVRAAGFTSIDVTRKGIDKAYGIRQIRKQLQIPIGKMLFVGDAIRPGGNDYAAIKTGVDYVKVSGPKEAKLVIRSLLRNPSQ